MVKLCYDNIETGVDYSKLGFIESSIMHDVKRLGVNNTVFKWSNSEFLNKQKLSLSDLEFRFMIACLEYLDSSFIYSELPYSKYVLDPWSYGLGDFKRVRVNLVIRYILSNRKLRRRGFLYQKLDKAV